MTTGRKLEGTPNHGGGSRRWFTEAIEGSLRRLKTDHIDVYELGVPDPETDLDETLGALTDLVAAGKIRSFGTSKMPPSQIAEARGLAERRGHGVFRTEEAPYSIVNRVVEYDLLPVCQRLGVGVLAFGALAGGWLSGRYRSGQQVALSGPAHTAPRWTRPRRPTPQKNRWECARYCLSSGQTPFGRPCRPNSCRTRETQNA